eukprot:5350727-Amphidinium_carterae.1
MMSCIDNHQLASCSRHKIAILRTQFAGEIPNKSVERCIMKSSGFEAGLEGDACATLTQLLPCGGRKVLVQSCSAQSACVILAAPFLPM